MIFSCFPPDQGCEWVNLRSFVDCYNKLRGKSYRRSACLEVERRNTKEPEVLLEANGEVPIVIERKSIVWPPGNEYFADHHKEHYLLNHFVSRLKQLGNPFTDAPYQLAVEARDLKSKKKREVTRFAGRIADIVLSHQANAKSQHGIGGRAPIPWRFRTLSPLERDETVPETGIGLKVVAEEEPPEPTELLQRIEEKKSGYSKEFERWANDAAKKFVHYAHCQKLFLVQFFGDSSIWLQDEDIVGIIKSAHLPETIDEVWLAQQDWISQDDYEITWEYVR